MLKHQQTISLVQIQNADQKSARIINYRLVQQMSQ